MVEARTEVAVEPGCVCCVWVWVSGWVHVLASSIGDSIWMRRCCFWLVSLGFGPQPWPGHEGKSRTAKKGFPLYDSGLQACPRSRGVPCLGTMPHTCA